MIKNEKKSLLSDVQYSLVLQLITYILPFITLYHITATIGLNEYGNYAIAFSIASIVVVIFDLGLPLFCIRKIAKLKVSDRKTGRILINVITIKSIMFLVAFPFLCMVYFLDESLKAQAWLILYIYFFSLNLEWFFQAINKIKIQLYLRVVTSFLQFLIVFVFIRTSEDSAYISISITCAWMLNFLISLIIIIRYNVFLSFPSVLYCKILIKNSNGYYTAKLFVSIIQRSAPLLIGYLSNQEQAGLYSLAEKLYSVASNIIVSLNRVLYPYMIRNKDLELINKLFVAWLFLSVPFLFVAYYFSDQIIGLIFGMEFIGVSSVLSIFALVFLFESANGFMGYPTLGVFGFQYIVNISITLTMSLLVFLILFLWVSNVELTANVFVFILAASFFIDFLIRFRYYILIKKKYNE